MKKNIFKLTLPFLSFLKRGGRSKNQAFTLIESIIVMVILGLSLSGSTYLMMTVTNAIAENRQRITAAYLVQECMELTRNIRDSAWKQNLPWDCAFQDMAGGITDGDIFRISVDTDSAPNAALGNLQQYCRSNLGASIERDATNFRLKKGTVLYGFDDGYNTMFHRKILVSDSTLDALGESNSAKFTCEVSWENRGNPQRISMSQILTNWKK